MNSPKETPDQDTDAIQTPDEGVSQPTAFEVDGESFTQEQVTEVLRNRRKMDAAAHTRNEQLRREREALEIEKRTWSSEREGQARERSTFLETLRDFAPKPAEEKDEPRSFAQLLEQENIDPVADERGMQKLGTLWDRTRAEDATRLERRLRENFEQRINAVERGMDGKVQQATRNLEQQSAREQARKQAEQSNRTMFERHLRGQHAELDEQLSDDDRTALYAAMTSLIGSAADGTPYGTLNQAGQYLWSERAAEDALWVAAPTRKLLLARETATARREGMLGGVRGEEASRSTIRRTQRRGDDSDDALAQKYQTARDRLSAGEITPEQALAAFTDKERARLEPMLASARARRV